MGAPLAGEPQDVSGFMVLSKIEYEFFDFEQPTSTARELAPARRPSIGAAGR